MFVPSLVFIDPKFSMSVWLVQWNPASLATFENRAKQINEAMLEHLSVAEDGTIVTGKDSSQDKLATVQKIARESKTKLFAMVSNYVDGIGFDPVRMSKLLKNPDKAAMELDGFARNQRFDGIDLDLENMVGSDRNNYSRFVNVLAKRLHQSGKSLSVTVHAKQEEPGGWDAVQAQDWVAIGKAADVVRIMCYDFSWATSKPGPIAPTKWVTNIAKFALTKIPKSKLDIGVPWYGYRWKTDGPADSLTFLDLKLKSTTIDPESGELLDGELIRFAGQEAFQQKLNSIQALGIHRFSAWYCGSEDPGVWKLIPRRL